MLLHCWLADKKDIQPVKIWKQQSSNVLLWMTYQGPSLTSSSRKYERTESNPRSERPAVHIVLTPI